MRKKSALNIPSGKILGTPEYREAQKAKKMTKEEQNSAYLDYLNGIYGVSSLDDAIKQKGYKRRPKVEQE